ncbi:hypothetical protein VN11_15935 [Stenotrophomonas maltophilia]|nr:hypothetical protein VN11_15935 [Stenotrophomonas maltophilia]
MRHHVHSTCRVELARLRAHHSSGQQHHANGYSPRVDARPARTGLAMAYSACCRTSCSFRIR